jgi:ABC-type multidrug transport system fused ATPase/permease subunit
LASRKLGEGQQGQIIAFHLRLAGQATILGRVLMEKKKSKALRSLVGVLAFMGKHPWRIAFVIVLLLANISIEMTLPQIIGNAITDLRWHIQWGAEFDRNAYVLLFLALVVARAAFGHVMGPNRNRLVQWTLTDLRSAIFDTMQRLSFSYHDKTNSGELISRSSTDIWRLQDFFFACLLMAVDITVSLAATIILIFLLSKQLGWMTVATVVPTIGLMGYYASRLQPQWRKVHDLHSEMTTVIQENIAGVRVVKAFAKEPAELGKFRRKRDHYIDTMMATVSFWAARVPLAQFVFGLGLPLALWIGGRQVIGGQLLIGDLVKVIFYILGIGNRMGAIGQFVNIVQNASASAERVMEIIQEPHRLKSGQRHLPTKGGEVVFESVSFRYEEGKASLTDVSFRAAAGKTYAIVGPTGSGKSTLVHLIPRYYEASGGQILIDGIDVRELDLRELRRSVGIIFQETFLFSASVAENIAYGRPEASREEIERCARAAQAHEFISALENGYDTIIGERGITLSGGQKQRVAIARAFLMNPTILILDDATASVDSSTEHLIQRAITELSAGRTTFIIAHRFSTVQHADEILVLKEGKLIERGRHHDLIRREGFYSEIFQQQIRPDRVDDRAANHSMHEPQEEPSLLVPK